MKWWRNRSCSAVIALIVSTIFTASGVVIASAPAGAITNGIVLTIDTTASECFGTTVDLPLYSANSVALDATVDFGDGTTDDVDTTSGVLSHTYASPGSYTVTITGTVPQFGTADPSINSADCSLTAVTNWDGVGLTSLDTAFNGDTNLVSVPGDLPNTVTDLADTFLGATSFNQNLESWDTTNVVAMNSMFAGATSFNNGGGPLATTSGGWDTSNVTTMASLFSGDSSFNQDVESWNTAAVGTMDAMFYNDFAFDNGGGPLATTSGGWDTENVSSMAYMFYNDAVLDLDVESWRTSQVTDMSFMFFDDAVFDNGESLFNTVPGRWDTADVSNMAYMFTFDVDFNQDVSSWLTQNVASMQYMFFKAGAFDQDLGQWNLASVTDVAVMLDNTSLSTSNYDATLEGWANQSVHSGLTLGASGLTYDAAGAAARNTLTSSPDDWTIQGDSDVTPPSAPTTSPLQQATLTVSAVATNTLSQPVALAVSGGSGTGAVNFSVTDGTATGCAVSDNVLRATSAGTCIVTATKAADSTYAETTSAPLAITFDVVAAPPTPLPGRLTVGFSRTNGALGAAERRAVIRLSRKLTSSDIVTVTAYAWHDVSLAHRRAHAVAALLTNAHVKMVIVTRRAAASAVIVTRA
jgi:surface protein